MPLGIALHELNQLPLTYFLRISHKYLIRFSISISLSNLAIAQCSNKWDTMVAKRVQLIIQLSIRYVLLSNSVQFHHTISDEIDSLRKKYSILLSYLIIKAKRYGFLLTMLHSRNEMYFLLHSIVNDR